ncbi:hypothetical protein [Pseudoalteromonas rubra]|uniref:Uncharacterized protein n=1 Tax=Pseudoalteromonas rubra TaxID=43658 RepID=A0A0F4QF50_9GAMM|nr:hypothetical protein [Pseudoalteromonas rubra]KJZ05889.1 hypothetical protein TW77_21225 [Pseudoalteromonas rubra]
MSTLIFRLCEAADGSRFGCLSDRPEVPELFDLGYALASPNRHCTIPTQPHHSWVEEYSVEGEDFAPLTELEEIPREVKNAFNALMSELISGVDVMFCSYALGNALGLPVCDEVMDSHCTTDFVLFPQSICQAHTPDIPAYLVCYSVPRGEPADPALQQHRIYCQPGSFAFAQAFSAIIEQRGKAGLKPQGVSPTDKRTAQQALNRFTDCLRAYHRAHQ